MSKTSQSIFNILGAISFKDRIDFLKPRRSGRTKTPVLPHKQYKTTTIQVHGRTVCTVEPLDGQISGGTGHVSQTQQTPQIHMIYFHGGGYSMEASGLHFALMKTLIKKTGCPLSYVDYPLAPEHTASQTIAMCLETYQTLSARYPDHRFVLIGDSAGGGLALALAMQLRDDNVAGLSKLQAPLQIIVFSPWLDISLSNPEIPTYQDKDVILEASGLRKIAEVYRGDLPADHYLVSPMFGDLTGVGPVAVFYGTEEILYPDCEEFCTNRQQAGFQVTGHLYEGMQHDWVILPTPEAKRAIEEVCRMILQ